MKMEWGERNTKMKGCNNKYEIKKNKWETKEKK